MAGRFLSPDAAPANSAAPLAAQDFETVPADTLVPGDTLAVAAPGGGFAPGSILSIAVVAAQGAYRPAVAKPYILVDGVLTPT